MQTIVDLNAYFEYIEGMKSTLRKQYTIRNLSRQLDEKLRQKTREAGKSLNEVVLETLHRGVGLSDSPVIYHDLDPLVGSWKDDPPCDEALRMQDQIDPKVWS